MNGYKEAKKLDALVNRLAEEHPVTKEDAREWLVLTRIVTSGLDILRDKALDILLRGGN